MEDELAARLQQQDRVFLQDHYNKMFSEMWIGSVYETIRLLRSRGLVERTEKFEGLAHDLRLLRIPLDKHEIPIGPIKERRMSKVPPNGSDGFVRI